jgi:hypothetical protein
LLRDGAEDVQGVQVERSHLEIVSIFIIHFP